MPFEVKSNVIPIPGWGYAVIAQHKVITAKRNDGMIVDSIFDANFCPKTGPG